MRIDFSDPQRGKGPCDRKAVVVKNHMRYLNSGHDNSNTEDMKLAVESNGSVRGVASIRCGPLLFLTQIPFKNGKESGSSTILRFGGLIALAMVKTNLILQ